MRPDTFLRDDGQRGAVVDRINGPDGTPLAVIEFPDGMRFEVPESLLPDAPGEDAPALSRKVVEAGGGRIIIPVIAEQLSVEKRSVPRTIVRVHKRVESRDEVIEEPLLKQTVTVERIPINQLVEGEPPAPRQEGEWTVIPIVEEVLVVEKRLMLVEEVRVARQETTVQEPQTVTLLREVVEVERLPAGEASRNGRDDAPIVAKEETENAANSGEASDADLPNIPGESGPPPAEGETPPARGATVWE
jgi:uncharacterized protein (TIGR02271 family)